MEDTGSGGNDIFTDNCGIDSNFQADDNRNEEKKMMMFLGCLLFLLKITTGNVWASENSGYYLSPPLIQIEIDKNDGEVPLEIGNYSNNEVVVRLSAVDFGSLDESGGTAFLGQKGSDVERKYGLASWIILPKNSLILPPKSKEKLKIIIANKDSLSPGGHYGAVLATMEESGNEKENVSVRQSIASLIMVKKNGGEIVGLELKDFELSGSWLLKPDRIKLRWENFGNVHLIPRGRVEIADGFGRRVASGTLNEDSKIILPETFRYYDNKIRWEKKWLWPGKYRVKIFYRYTDNPSFETKSFEYWYMGKLWLGVGVILLAAGSWFLFKKLPELVSKMTK